jgi:hypothetical protein
MVHSTGRQRYYRKLYRQDCTCVGTYRMPDSRRVQRPSMSLPAFMISKPPPKLRQAESVSAASENLLGDERHVAHKVCAVTTRRRNEIKPMVVRAHVKYFNHCVMSTTAFALSSDLWTMSSRQPTSCLMRFATIISYSFIAADEKARFQGLRCCICNTGSHCATSIGGPSRPSQPDYSGFQMNNSETPYTHVDPWVDRLARAPGA